MEWHATLRSMPWVSPSGLSVSRDAPSDQTPRGAHSLQRPSRRLLSGRGQSSCARHCARRSNDPLSERGSRGNCLRPTGRVVGRWGQSSSLATRRASVYPPGRPGATRASVAGGTRRCGRACFGDREVYAVEARRPAVERFPSAHGSTATKHSSTCHSSHAPRRSHVSRRIAGDATAKVESRKRARSTSPRARASAAPAVGLTDTGNEIERHMLVGPRAYASALVRASPEREFPLCFCRYGRP